MLIIVMGISGSGKSTIAKKVAEERGFVYISSDEIRKELWGDESDQRNPVRVFWVAEHRTNVALSQGNGVVVDATNLNKRARKPFILAGKRYGVPIQAIMVHVPIEIAKERNKLRARLVPDAVIEKQLFKLSPPNLEEVDGIEIVNNY